MVNFAYFSIFSPKMRLKLLRMVNFTWFTTFPIFCHQSISFLEKSQKFSFLSRGGVHRQIFGVFQLFQIVSHQCSWEMTHNGKFGQKSGLDWVKMAIFAYFSIFPPKWGWDWLGMVNFTWFTTFPIFCHQSISFLEKSQKFSFLGGGILAIFWSFPTFSNCFTPMRLEMTHNGTFGQKCGLDWAKMAIFAYFSIFSPQNEAEITCNGQFHLIHNFSHLLPPKHLIFGEISKIFISGRGGTSANFLEFSNFSKSFHTNVAGNDPQWQIWPINVA